MLEGIEILFEPKAWPVIALVIVLGVAGTAVYHQFVEPDVYRLELVKPGCKDYITLPLVECKEGTELKITHCRCSTQWVPVTNEAERQMAIDKRPSGYRVEY